MEWINLNEKQPMCGVSVLAYCIAEYQHEDGVEGLGIEIAYLEVDGKWYLDSKNLDDVREVTHWMPLPKEPK